MEIPTMSLEISDLEASGKCDALSSSMRFLLQMVKIFDPFLVQRTSIEEKDMNEKNHEKEEFTSSSKRPSSRKLRR
jgi:hypothetical protein